jgi:predicted lipid-binding transport protein (Tim44 family)
MCHLKWDRICWVAIFHICPLDPIRRLPNTSQDFGGYLLSMAVDLPFSILDLSAELFLLFFSLRKAHTQFSLWRRRFFASRQQQRGAAQQSSRAEQQRKQSNRATEHRAQSNRATEQQSNRAAEQQSSRAAEQQSSRAAEQQSNRAYTQP